MSVDAVWSKEQCPRCGHKEIVSFPGHAIDWCGYCGSLWTYSLDSDSLKLVPLAFHQNWASKKWAQVKALFT